MGRVLTAPGVRLRVVATAGRGEGRGHLARALALAEAAAEAGITAEIVLLRGWPSAVETTRAAGAGATLRSGVLPPTPEGIALVVDLPDPSEVPAAQLARATAFDDSGALRGHVAIVVQPSLPAWDGVGRATASRVLAGYRYAPLSRAIIAAARGRPSEPRRDKVPRLLVCFGGSDPHDVVGRIAPALAGSATWQTIVVVGPDYRGSVESARGLTVLRDPPDLPALLAGADIGVIGAGTMKFELAALGVPAVLLAAADDQLAVGPGFAATGAAAWAGDGRTADPAAVRANVDGLVRDRARREAMGAAGPVAVGLRGAEEIVRAATATGQASATRS